MAFMSQDNKRLLEVGIKAILTKYGLKGSLSVRHYSTLVLNIKSGKIDFIRNFNEVGLQSNINRNQDDRFQDAKGYIQVNEFWYHEHFSGQAKECLGELIHAMNIGNHDNSDVQTDFFDIGWYSDINIGQWDKPYQYTGKAKVDSNEELKATIENQRKTIRRLVERL